VPAPTWQHRWSVAASLFVVTVLALLGVVLVLFVAAVVATRDDQAMADAAQDLPDLGLPAGPLEPQDVAAVRFSMAPRGYRMSEVDAVLERLAEELADRDRQLGELQGAHLLDEDLLDEDDAVAGER
jgi:DivIVA domain-containing protein